MKLWLLLLLSLTIILQICSCSPTISSFDRDYEDEEKVANALTPRQLITEIRMPKRTAFTADGRSDMKAKKEDPFDPDCDSPQLGETEPNPISETSISMNNENPTHMNSTSTTTMKEQNQEEREVLTEGNNVDVDEATLFSSKEEEELAKPFEKPVEFDVDYRTESLPLPNQEEAKKSKCSRFLNGHDVPPSLHVLDDDCGMPEPEIPCETEGNSTLCVERIQLSPPPPPKAEVMPPVPAPDDCLNRAHFVNTSVEFVDFGITRTVYTIVSQTVGRVIEEAGAEFGIREWSTQLIRSGGIDVLPNVLIHDLAVKQQIVVYLSCVYRQYLDKLIMPIPACEDLLVRNLTARVEIPAFHQVYEVHVLSTDRVGSAIIQTPFLLNEILDITYNGKSVSLETPLEEIYFRNGSAFVIYPKEPCPSQSSTPSQTPSPLPSLSPTASAFPVKNKLRIGGIYDTFRICRNSNGEIVQPPDPESLGLDPSIMDNIKCEDAPVAVVEDTNYGPSRVENTTEPAYVPSNFRDFMKVPALIQASFEGRQIPVLVTPNSKGIDVFDAVERSSGKSHGMYIVTFMNQTFNHYTPLKPLGLIDGDVVVVKNLV